MSAYAQIAPDHDAATSLLDRLPPVINPLRWLRRRFLRRPGSTMALGLAAVMGGAITVNALALQTERHPAPMFTKLAEPVAVAAVPSAAPVPSAQTPAARRTEAADVPLPPVRTARTSSRETEPQRAPVAPAVATQKDQMAALIRTATTPAAPAPTAEVPKTEASQRIVLVQRALNKLGYGPLKVDGDYGSASRQALERFEADRRLAVRGEPMGRSLRELARASGLDLE